MKKYLSEKNSKLIDDYVKNFGKIGILTSALGAILQYINLMLLGKGSWILIYYSLTYILLEGLHYTLYFFIFIICLEIIGNWFDNNILGNDKVYKFILGSSILFLCLMTLIISKTYQIRIYLIPFILIMFSIGIMFILVSTNPNVGITKNDEIKNHVFHYFTLFVLTVILLNILSLFKPDYLLRDHTKFFARFPSISKEVNKNQKINKIYANDNYVFISITDVDLTNKLIIKEVSTLLDSKENAISSGTFLSN